MPFEKSRILTDREACTIRGKCLVGHATPAEQMLLIGHFDLVDQQLRGALESLRGCMPPIIYVYGAYGERWSADEPNIDEFEAVDFAKLLGE